MMVMRVGILPYSLLTSSLRVGPSPGSVRRVIQDVWVRPWNNNQKKVKKDKKIKIRENEKNEKGDLSKS